MTLVDRSMLAALLLALASPAHADRQVIAPGTGLQSAVEVDSGPNGICETRARGDDPQAAKVGQGAPFQDEIRCGPDYSRSTTSSAKRRRFSTRPRRLWWMFRRRATSSLRSSA